MRVGFIGVGRMGEPMARHVLEAGYELAVHDVVRDHAEALLRSGAVWADSPAEAAQGSEVVFTSLPGPGEVEAVALGRDGILEKAERGSVYVDLTTSSPVTIRRIRDAFTGKGVSVLDAPVSGGVEGARSGNLAIMVGGDGEAYRRVKPVLDVIGNKVVYCGALGSGTVCKLCNNLISLSLGILLAEALTLGVKAGVELKTLTDVISGSSGKTLRMEGFPAHLFRGDFEPGFSLELGLKDLRLAVDLARELGVPMEMGALAEQRHLEAVARGWGQKSSDAVVMLQEERTGVSLRLP